MNRKIFFIIPVLLLAVMSCKKDDETTSTSSYLSGTLSFNSRAYITVGTQYTFTPTGVTHPEDKRIGYYWKVSPNSNNESNSDTTLSVSKADTLTSDGSLTFLFAVGEDKRSLSYAELTDYTVTAYAFATDYSNKSASALVTLVKPGFAEDCSLTDTGIDINSDNVFNDSRDDRTYFTSKIGNRTWYKHNNAYYTDSSDTLEVAYYINEPVAADLFGGFYTFEAAKKSCPEGWRLPSDEDWAAAASAMTAKSYSAGENWEGASAVFLSNAKFNGIRLWGYRPEIKIPDSPLFCAFPMGYARDMNKLSASEMQSDDTTPYYASTFDGVQTYGAFWTSTEDPTDPEKAYYRYFVLGDTTVHIGSAYKDSFAINVRCCK